jgi:ferric-dicitrate binding protein FerR (iron transport regulator)
MNKEEQNLQDYLQKIKFKDKIVLNHEDVKASFVKIKERIDLPNEVVIPPVKKVNLFATLPFKIAASIAIVLTLSLVGYNYYEGKKQIVLANSTESVKDFVLPDGSKVSMRSNSTLSYRANYNSNRNVQLQGEALFEVTKNKQFPFTVETETGKVTVLGTVFSVRAYADEHCTKTLLKEGSVKMTNNDDEMLVVLKPGDEALLNEGATTINIHKVENIERELAWQSHNFSFENEPLDTILTVISDAFDKKLEIKDKVLAKKRYTLKFNRDESLSRMLDILSEVAKFNYRLEKDYIIVGKK